MDSKLRKMIKDEYKNIQIPNSLYEFAHQVPDIVEEEADKTPTIKRAEKKWFKKSVIASLVTVACSAFFMLGVNQSTSFANYVDKIPLLSQLSELLQFDKGLETALDHGLLQKVSKSATDQGITFTIDNVIADAKRTFVFFNIEFNETQEIDGIYLANFKATDGGNRLFFEMKNRLFNWPEDTELLPRQISLEADKTSSDNKKYLGWMEIVNTNKTDVLPSTIALSIQSLIVTKGEKMETIIGDWDVSFKTVFDHVDSRPLEYKGKEFSVKAGSYELDFAINYTKVFPTMTEMSMDLKTDVKAGIYYHYHLENEAGKIYKHIEDGILTDSGDVLPQFESSYFDEPQKLYLVIDEIMIITPDGTSMKEEILKVNERIALTE